MLHLSSVSDGYLNVKIALIIGYCDIVGDWWQQYYTISDTVRHEHDIYQHILSLLLMRIIDTVTMSHDIRHSIRLSLLSIYSSVVLKWNN